MTPCSDNVESPDLVGEGMKGEDTCSVGGLRCHSSASCRDRNPGFCCQCPQGTYGNGENCVSNGG